MKSSRPRRRGCLFPLIGITSLILIFLLVSGSWPSMRMPWAARPVVMQSHLGEDEFPSLTEIRAYGSGSNKVVQVFIRGLITMDADTGLFAPPGSTAQAMAAVRRATHDPSVKALILDIDSGGGGITASDILLNEILRFRKSRPDRRVVAIFGDVAASGAYYVALGSDHIIARPTSLTGSIGVILQSLNVKVLAEKLGIADVTIKSGKDKDILNPLSELTPDQRAMLQSLIDALHDRFVQLVVEHRNLPEEDVRVLANGRVFLATDALEAKLIDEIGYWNDAMIRVEELLQVDRIAVIRYETAFSLSKLLRGNLSGLIRNSLSTLMETRSPLSYQHHF